MRNFLELFHVLKTFDLQWVESVEVKPVVRRAAFANSALCCADDVLDVLTVLACVLHLEAKLFQSRNGVRPPAFQVVRVCLGQARTCPRGPAQGSVGAH